MDNESNAKSHILLKKISAFVSQKHVPNKYENILKEFASSYKKTVLDHGSSLDDFIDIFTTFIDLLDDQFYSPHNFKCYHQKIRHPIDYYAFGLNFLRPLVDIANSTVRGINNVQLMENYLRKKENVIIFSNHQIEADPQAISILLENSHPEFGENLIFVAGARVTSDPLAIPFSLGRNLLCIYSKKYIDDPPEKKHEKQMHNKRSMEHMVELLSKGGCSVYVAPSGGRDRTNIRGEVEVAPFDPQSIEMFYLMAKKAKCLTHFFPLALSTHHLLPPPETLESELGESRITRGGAIHLSFGEELNMEDFPESKAITDKKEKRRVRAEYICKNVKEMYDQFPK